MRYKIILDSCGELPADLLADERFERVPLQLDVDDYHILDDENFNQKEFLEKVAASPNCPKSACPSPERYLQSMKVAADHVYVITLSSHLSGSYNAALLAQGLLDEEEEINVPGKKQVLVVDSESASIGETQLALMIMDLEEAGLPFEEIKAQVEAYRDEARTYFVLDSLEALRKNGRLTRVKALVASTLNIKPVMGEDHGVIIQRGQAVGMKKALDKMIDLAITERGDTTTKRLMISHCNCPERAEKVKQLFLKKAAFREVLILDTAGVSSLYASDGGVIVAF